MSTHPTSQPCRVSSCENTALYVCPRCHLPYCSVSCYSAHSQPCVDAFAEHALQPLRGLTVSPANRRTFNQMLERIRNEPQPPYAQLSDLQDDSGNDSDHVCEHAHVHTDHQTDTTPQSDCSGEVHVLEQLLHSLDEPGRHALFTVLNSAMQNACGRDSLPEPPSSKPAVTRKSDHDEKHSDASSAIEANDIADTLEMLVEEIETMNLSYDEVLSRLPKFLRNDFEKRLREGSLDQFVLAWTPWWQHAGGLAKTSSEEVHEPAPLPPLPLSNQLLVPLHIPRQRASSCLRYSVIDILAAHALSMRLCNGEWWGDAFVARTVWRISNVLSRDARYMSVDDVCSAVKKSIMEDQSHTLAMQVFRDVADILSGRSDWVVRAVYECQRVLEAGLKLAGSGKSEIRKRIRKVGFFVAWSMCQESEVFEELARKVGSFAELESGLAEEVRVATRVAKARRTPKITILKEHRV